MTLGRSPETRRKGGDRAQAGAATSADWHGGSYLGAPPVNTRQELSRGGWARKARPDQASEGDDIRRCRFRI